MYLTDTHSHLYDSAFDEDRPQALQRALNAGVKRIMLPAIDSGSHDALFSLCRTYPYSCFPMMGLHPTSVNDNPRWEGELALVERYLAEPPSGRFYAIGEVGLDLYWSRDWIERQTVVLERQIELSLKYGLPLVIHTRDAWPEMRRSLGRFKGEGIKGIMHSFSGGIEDYHAIKECGDFLFGIGGVVTYKKSDLPEILLTIPLDDIVLETDCPYLTPVPFRGKRNESAYLTYIRDRAAGIYGVSPEEVAAVTSANAARMFGLEPLQAEK